MVTDLEVWDICQNFTEANRSLARIEIMGLWQKYTELPRNVRLYIGLSTLVVAFVGDRWSRKIEEETRLRQEAEKRLAEEEIRSKQQS
ncbi:hypothetical protein TRVA0_054S00760 [Trichomonascus vanleenenianus]|uniref:uncharacterized protein n=1 Tax=Trichomonascus vanleenenianus TaxID=2268995 RepID=UPI003EC9851B